LPQFQINQYTPLYWAESSGFIPGRDAMGIQNSSVVIYSTLLPGITNLTERIRYYGFYCWLLDQYDRLREEKSSYRHQYDFVRRAELVIAFLMYDLHPDFVAIPGKAFAEDFFEPFKTEGSVDLSAGADKGKYLVDDKGENRSYWKYPSGAMGQYYAGALIALSLIKIKENYYLLLEHGKRLAQAFADSLNQGAGLFLLSIVKNGQLKYADLPQLSAFDISRIDEKSSEWSEYVNLLFNKDGQNKSTFQRRDTLVQYLRVCETDFPSSNWLLGQYFFQNRSEVELREDSASLGWYAYYTQELMHYAIEHIFNTMLLLMKKDLYEINAFVEEQGRQFILTATNYNINPDITLTEWIGSSTAGIQESPLQIKSELDKAAKELDFVGVYCLSLLLLVKTYKQVEGDVPAFYNYLIRNNIQERRGNIYEIHDLLNRNSDRTINEFFVILIRKILNDHQIVAFNKMGNGEVQVHKFLIEHNHLVQINHIAPRMTTPRLGSVKNMLEDLNLLAKDTQRPTELGIRLLAIYHQN
jgi:hypothetical protein